jgi:hypothetical protein
MKSIKSTSTLVAVLCGFLCIGFSVLYSNYLLKDPILERDDLLLVLPLKSVESFGSYIELVKNNTILDVQPVRDLTYFINIRIMNGTNLSTFHLTNFLLFLLSIYLFMKLLEALGFSRTRIICSGLLFAVHPVMVSSVGWISARKHSLALVFILLSLLSFLRTKKITFTCTVFYVLSILSHQIFILLPVWLYLYARVKKMKIELGSFSFMSIIGVVVLFVAVLKTFYLEMGNVTYKHIHWSENVSRYVLSVGRSVTQIVFPVSISGDYYQGSVLNLVGIPLLILALFWLYKSKGREDSLLWMGLAALTHVLTSITFVNDTYLYLPLICVIISANYYLKSNPLPVGSSIKAVMFGLCFTLLMTKTFSASQMWRSDKDLWQYSYANEGSPFTSIILGAYLFNYNEKMAMDFMVWGVKNYDITTDKLVFFLFLENLHKSSLPIQEKIRIFSECYVDHEIYKESYAVALMEGTEEQVSKGVAMIKPYMKYIDTKEKRESHGITTIKAIQNLCMKSKESQRVCLELNVKF